MSEKSQKNKILKLADADYDKVLLQFIELLDVSRRTSARAVNSVMTATYWEIGRRIVEIEQQGKERAEYGEEFLIRLAQDLTKRFGRGFQKSNLYPGLLQSQ